jgi:hypothetical protein
MTHDISGLADTLLRNHITVNFPRSDALSELAQLPEGSSDSERRQLEYAIAADNLIVRMNRTLIRIGLSGNGHRQALDRIGINSAGDWAIHFYFADAAALAVLPSLTDGTISRDNPVEHNAKAFIESRLKRLERSNRLTGRYRWWDVDD